MEGAVEVGEAVVVFAGAGERGGHLEESSNLEGDEGDEDEIEGDISEGEVVRLTSSRTSHGDFYAPRALFICLPLYFLSSI